MPRSVIILQLFFDSRFGDRKRNAGQYKSNGYKQYLKRFCQPKDEMLSPFPHVDLLFFAFKL
jgi:hypothetical protein